MWFYDTNENPYLSINIILLSTLSIINLIEIWDTYNYDELYTNHYGHFCYRRRALWPLGAGLWPVPVTFALWVGTIHCQRKQRLGKDISKTIATIKALVSSTEREI